MKCSNCNKIIKDNVKFCPYCGHPIKSSNISKRERLLYLFSISFIIIIFILFYLAKNEEDLKSKDIKINTNNIVHLKCGSLRYSIKFKETDHIKRLELIRPDGSIVLSKYDFNSQTVFSKFYPVCRNDKLIFIRFNAKDDKWDTKYLWDFNNNIFYYITKRLSNHKIFYSPKLDKNYNIKELIKSIELDYD